MNLNEFAQTEQARQNAASWDRVGKKGAEPTADAPPSTDAESVNRQTATSRKENEIDMNRKKCLFCKKPLTSDVEEYHRACVTAYGLDYDPTSEADAQAFLARRSALALKGDRDDGTN